MERAELTRRLVALPGVVERGGNVFVCDAAWSAPDRVQAEALMARAAVADAEPGAGWLMIRTGGTGGGVKFARHDERTLRAAVGGFCQHFGLDRVNALGLLPIHHVSGLMGWARCALTGGEYLAWDWKRLEAGHRPTWPTGRRGDWVVSLVPTQLQRLLAEPAARAWLREFRLILLGGGPTWPALAEAAAAAGLPIALSYGLTETAAMVTALQPDEFLAGVRSDGRALPHAQVRITADGLVAVAGSSVFRGYWPEWCGVREFVTEDLGTIDASGHLRVLGRRDALIISGGRKIAPAEVEAALRASGEFDDVAVIGVPDATWGERVVACYPARAGGPPDIARAVAGLASYQRPKTFVPLESWPRNAQGKIDRAALRARVAEGEARAAGG